MMATYHEDERWVANEGNGCGEFSLVAPTVGAGQLVSVLGQPQFV